MSMLKPHSVRSPASDRPIYHTAMIAEGYLPEIQSYRGPREQSLRVGESSSPSLIIQTRDEQAFHTQHLQLLNLCDLALAFIACLTKQDTNPLPITLLSNRTRSRKLDNSDRVSSSGTDLGQAWDQNRKQLDDIFRVLASWRRDLDSGKPQLNFDHDGPLISALDGIFTSFLTICHQLTHLNPNYENPETIDPVLLDVTNSLFKEVEVLEQNRGIVNDYCAVCSNQEHNDTSGYLHSMAGLVSDLTEDSKPLQLAMRRRDWVGQAESPGKKHLARFDDLTTN